MIGGGPAGAVAARRLAQLGHEVCLVERRGLPRPHVGTSLPPRILPLLESIGVLDRLDPEMFVIPRRAIVRWSDASDATERVPGLEVDRARFDEGLLAGAHDAGVRVLRPATALAPTHYAAAKWRVPVRRERRTLEMTL